MPRIHQINQKAWSVGLKPHAPLQYSVSNTDIMLRQRGDARRKSGVSILLNNLDRRSPVQLAHLLKSLHGLIERGKRRE